MEPRDLLHLENIIEFCDNIRSAVSELSITYDSLVQSTTKMGVLAFFVEHIGEEAGKLSKSFTENHPQIEWKAIVNFRHRIVHAYASIDPDVLWDSIQNDIPELRNICEKIISEQSN